MANVMEAGNFGNYFIRHSGYRGRIDANDGSWQFLQDSSFEPRPGLADNTLVSFESVNYPGHFLRHRNFEVWLDRFEDNDLFRRDATFRQQAGLANNAWTSFESLNYPNHFIRHQNFELFLQQRDGTELYNQDATFEQQLAGPNPKPKLPVEASEEAQVGNSKKMHTKAILYTNGVLSIETFSQSGHNTEALRGHVLIICVDTAGRAIWVSQDYRCTTRCAKWDLTCASAGTDSFLEYFPEVVGRHTASLGIVQSEEGLGNFRNVVINGLKTAGDIAAELKEQINRTFG